ncbi:hypothetical protein K439DRAFT_1342605, partial [Ramaria rubella]
MPLLSTDYHPDLSDSKEIKARLEQQHCELRRIDEKVTDLEEQLAAMKKIQAIWQLRCEVSEALLAPIRKLPHEILGKILTFCIPPLRLVGLGDRDEPAKTHPHDARYVLLCVCRRWKQVMDETPEVWSTIALDRP